LDITYSIFPKFFAGLDVKGLAALVREVGLDTVNLTIRKGYWVTQENLAEEAPAFVKAMADEGIKVSFATAGYMPEEMADGESLRILADSGITDFRMGYFKKAGRLGMRQAQIEARRAMEGVAEVCAKAKIRAVYQVHHGTDIINAMSAYQMVKDLPPQHVGIMLDPGNQAHEGWEKWPKAASLLGDYLAAWGIKDTAIGRDESKVDEASKGWHQYWVPCDQGRTNWYEVGKACQQVNFRGTFVFMPFYSEKDKQEMRRLLKPEVAYVRQVMENVAAGATGPAKAAP
jgi:sugar phosphate isomerase/epimerase